VWLNAETPVDVTLHDAGTTAAGEYAVVGAEVVELAVGAGGTVLER